jgi:SEC-C motif-containing protein
MYIDGVPAPTAEALMRSRYTAFVRGAIDYLMDTHDPATRASAKRKDIAQWSKDTLWMGLEIVEAKEDVVEFIARGVTNGRPFVQRERSRFRQQDGRWYYVDGKVTA